MKFKAKTAHNPDGYGLFLTRKFVKKMFFRTILPYLVVANNESSIFYASSRALIVLTYSDGETPCRFLNIRLK